MTTKLRLLALLLSFVLVLSVFVGCNEKNGDNKDTASASASETVSETELNEKTEKATETEEETDEPTETETQDPRLEYSRSREEMEAMLTLTNEDFAKTEELIRAFETLGVVSEDLDAVDASYKTAEDSFYYLQTQIGIASIIYYLDMSDEEASSRYLDAYDLYGDVYNVYIDCCRSVYNSSPIRDEVFADWTEDDIKELFAYDPEMQELREKNEEILVEINELTGEDAYDRTAVLYAEMVTNYNKLAKLCGYDNYYLYAASDIYGRDYDIDQVKTFASLVQDYYVPNVDTLNDLWYGEYSSLSKFHNNLMYGFLMDPFDQISRNYLNEYINSLEGSMKEGMSHMFDNRNVIFTNSKNSHQSAFQTYLHDLETPFCLFGSEGQSTTTIVHEMGHYYAALYNENSPSLDLAETQSQGNEMMLMDYLSGAMPEPVFKAYKDYTMYLYTVQSIVCVIVDEFEREVYSLESVEGFTSEDFDAIMDKVCENYGGIDYVTENITPVKSYWRSVATNSPVYYITYAVTMTEALNIYAELEKDRATGREIYRQLCEDVTEEETFLGAIGKAGLGSPFEEATFVSIMAMMLPEVKE